MLHIQTGGLFLVGVVVQEVAPLLVFSALERLVVLLQAYTGALTAASLKENFMAAHHVVDELLDGGLPFNLEPNVVHELVRVPSLLGRLSGGAPIASVLPEGVLSPTPWRRAPVAYTSNEIYVDVIEELHAIVDGLTGLPLPGTLQVRGRVQVDCALSGQPDLLLRLTPLTLLEDVAFHPCVRLARWQRERVISFVPPDGRFTLLEYRVGGDLRLPLSVRPAMQLSETASSASSASASATRPLPSGSGSLHVTVTGARVLPADKTVEEVAVVLPLGAHVAATTLSSKTGTVSFDETTKICTWTLKALPAAPPQLDGTFSWQGERPAKPVLHCTWRVMGWAASGLKVESLTLQNEKYNHFKGVKLLTLGHVDVRL